MFSKYIVVIALITGITGQDGYFLTKLLLSKGYEVHGVARRNSISSKGNLVFLKEEELKQIIIHYGDVTDSNFIVKLISELKPDELYHLAAQSYVALSFDNPSFTYDVNIGGTLNVVNAVKQFSENTRLYFAATSEMFGQPAVSPQNEQTPLAPRSPYAVSKLAGFWTVRTYREAYKLYMSNGILFNHESEFRGPEFVTRKIARHVAMIASGIDTVLELGNLNARKDWGYAGDYVDAMWRMLNYKYGDDFVIGTGVVHTVREFVEESFRFIGIGINWRGSGLNEVGLTDSEQVIVRVNRNLFRPTESDNYQADFTKAKERLGWQPKVNFRELVKIMVDSEIRNIRNERD